MARYIGPRCKLSRREGTDLFFKSPIRSVSSKCKIKTKPGQHGAAFKKLSDYAIQFREKQKVKRMYGMLEKQFTRFFSIAVRMKGNTGYNLLLLLERRLDNVVYRLGFATTRAEARQIVSHKHILINDKIVNIPSFLVSIDDVVSVREKVRNSFRIQSALQISQQLKNPDWVEVDTKKLEGKLLRYPVREDLDTIVNESLIVELYSK